MTRVMSALLAALSILATGFEARAVLAIPPSSATPQPTPTPQATPTPNPIEQPPAGITATVATLAQVLRSYRRSFGTATKRVATMRETDALSAWGETGSYTEIQSGSDFVDTMQLGPSSFSNGSYQGQRWRRNSNGYTRLVTGVHEENYVSAQAVRRSVLGGSTENVRLLGEVASNENAYVVEVHPPAGRHEWLFFDKSTGRLVREEEARVARRIVWTFDDYRTTNGILAAWHQHYSDGYPKNEMDWRITSLQYNVPVSSTELQVPASRKVVQFPAGVDTVRLPARVENGKVIIRVDINGRGLDFALDSGASSIVIDRDVARGLGLQTFGESTQTMAGTFEQSSAIVPVMKIGDLTMNDVVVDSLPFNFDVGAHTKIVGLLGYDFLAGMVAKIDYVSGTVDAFEPSSFGAVPGEVFELKMALDDAVPMVGARIGGSEGDYFLVDTGSDFVVVFSAFADAHPDDVSDSDFSAVQDFFFPVVEASGVGGGLSLIPTRVGAFHFAGVGFQHFLVFLVRNAPAFEGEDDDGLIGYEFLKYFDVYFDYRNSMLMLQPNALLRAQSAPASHR